MGLRHKCQDNAEQTESWTPLRLPDPRQTNQRNVAQNRAYDAGLMCRFGRIPSGNRAPLRMANRSSRRAWIAARSARTHAINGAHHFSPHLRVAELYFCCSSEAIFVWTRLDSSPPPTAARSFAETLAPCCPSMKRRGQSAVCADSGNRGWATSRRRKCYNRQKVERSLGRAPG